jgi:hypothetical protein
MVGPAPAAAGLVEKRRVLVLEPTPAPTHAAPTAPAPAGARQSTRKRKAPAALGPAPEDRTCQIDAWLAKKDSPPPPPQPAPVKKPPGKRRKKREEVAKTEGRFVVIGTGLSVDTAQIPTESLSYMVGNHEKFVDIVKKTLRLHGAPDALLENRYGEGKLVVATAHLIKNLNQATFPVKFELGVFSPGDVHRRVAGQWEDASGQAPLQLPVFREIINYIRTSRATWERWAQKYWEDEDLR